MANDFDIDEEIARQEAEESEKEFKRPENVGMPDVDPNFDEKDPESGKTPVELDVSESDIVKALKVAQEGISELDNTPSEKIVDARAERPQPENIEEVIQNEMKPTAVPRTSRRRASEGTVQEVKLIEYTVGRGEKLRHIAARFGTSATAIEKLNHLHNPRHLVSGQVLLIKARKGKS